MKRIAALLFGLTLAAPAAAINMPQPAPVKSIDWLPATTVRIGQGINAAYRIITLAGQTSEIWLHSDCRTQEKTLLFIDAEPGKGLRVYATDSIDRYTPGTPFEPDANSLFMTKPELDLCRQNIAESKWAGITAQSQPDGKLFVDVNNSRREAGMLKVRLATDYARINYDDKYGAPYSVKVQDIMFNCKKDESMILATFSLDNRGVMSDAVFAKNAKFETVPSDRVSVAKELCAIKDFTGYTGNGTLTWREKEQADNKSLKPDFDHNTPEGLQRFAFSATVSDTLNKLYADPRQIPAFRSISYKQTGPENDGMELIAKIDAQPDGTTLTIARMAIANAAFYSQYQRLFNIVDIKKWEIMSDAPWVSNTLDNTIILPLSPGKVYASSSQIENSNKPGQAKLLSQTCIAGKKWHSAADLNANFPGRYLEIICKGDRGDGRETSSDYAYFETLRVFIRIGYQENGQPKRFTFSDVEISR